MLIIDYKLIKSRPYEGYILHTRDNLIISLCWNSQIRVLYVHLPIMINDYRPTYLLGLKNNGVMCLTG
jgi:hypothetical protein